MLDFSSRHSALLPELPPPEGYDLIGDVHGCATTLERLLQRLGYRKRQGVYQHAKRRAIFLGDVIDRGPHIREALLLVHSMVQNGSAHMVLGNHEHNALTYCTQINNPHTQALEYLRPHTSANTALIADTLEQFANYPAEWQELLQWFRNLPLFMELGSAQAGNAFRVVHACWDHAVIAQHKACFGDGHFDEAFLHQSVNSNSVAAKSVQRLTRGLVFPLPQGLHSVAHDGYKRSSFRTKFWAQDARTYGDLLFQPDPIPADIAALPISQEHRAQMVRYGIDQPPLFIGHYWLKGRPTPLAHNIACLDYSAVKDGRLVAYRMDGEQQLQPQKFVWEDVKP